MVEAEKPPQGVIQKAEPGRSPALPVVDELVQWFELVLLKM